MRSQTKNILFIAILIAFIASTAVAGAPDGSPFPKSSGGQMNVIMGGEGPADDHKDLCNCKCGSFEGSAEDYTVEEQREAIQKLIEERKEDIKNLKAQLKALKKRKKS